jgi:ABC-2 type transport system permease protein
LTWVSPIGWAEKMEPWGANRWWPLLLIVALTALCAAAAWILEARRDHGAGLLAPRRGKATASRGLTTVAGLGFRLQRGGLIGWAIVLIVAGGLFGSVANQMTDLMSKISLAVFESDTLNTLISVFVALLALIVAIAGVQSASHLRGDEAIGTLESQLAGRVSRTGWVLRRLAVSLVAVAVLLLASGATFGSVYGQSIGDSGQTGRIALAMLVYLPAAAIMIGVVVLGLGWWPRLANSVAWVVIGLMWFLVLFGPDLKLPSWVMRAIPFVGTPRLPADPMSWPPVLIMAGVAVVMIAVGLVGFRRRDVPA